MQKGAIKASHHGVLEIGDKALPCAVLDDGTRVLNRMNVIRAIGRTGGARGGREYDKQYAVPEFLAANNIKPFIPSGLLNDLTPIMFQGPQGRPSIGYKAECLPGICGVFIDADEAGQLLPVQKHIAKQCRMLIRAFATVGIIALVDEATGYQDFREKKALQAILDRYLRKELAAWAKRFPDEFYEQMFRLKDWKMHDLNKTIRPRIFSQYTNDLVYERLAPGLLEELQKKNPRNEKGYKPKKNHQWLSDDVGHPALAQHLHAIIGLMRASPNWDMFYRLLQRAFPRKSETMLLEACGNRPDHRP